MIVSECVCVSGCLLTETHKTEEEKRQKKSKRGRYGRNSKKQPQIDKSFWCQLVEGLCDSEG